MADVLVQLNQADNIVQSEENHESRMLGWAVAEQALVFQEEQSDESRVSRVVPSLNGPGMGRRVAKVGHGFPQWSLVRFDATSGWVLAQSGTSEATFATHLVVSVPDANHFDVATHGAWTIPAAPSGPVYLADVAGGMTTTKPPTDATQQIGVGDGASLYLAIGHSSASLNLDVLVRDLNGRDDLNAHPKGDAGGDLGGAYADPIVRQLTGVGAALVPLVCDFGYTPETREASPTNGGRGIAPGRHFRTINGVVTDERCWAASSEYGEMFWSFDNWRTSVMDTSIRTGGPTASGYTNCYRWGTLKFVWMAGTIQSYAWVRGCGRSNGSGSSGVPGIFYAKHTASNYNADGSLKESAWQFVAWSGINTNGINKPSTHGATFAWLGDSAYIGRTEDFATWENPVYGGVSTYRFAGLSNDSYGTWCALSRYGDIWVSVPDADGKEAKAWSKSETLQVSVDGGRTYTDMAALPHSDGTSWGSLQCGYGLWLACVYQAGTNGYAYAYSEDLVHWIVHSGSLLPAFYDAGFDGARWYVTNINAKDTLAGNPPLYQLLLDSIAVKRQLVMEHGMFVAGDAYLLDTQNADVLGTDANGKVIPKTIERTENLDDLGDVSATSPANGSGLCFDTSTGLWRERKVTVSTASPSGTPADGDLWFKVSA